MPKFDKNTAKEAGKKSKRGKSEKTKQWEILSDAILNKHTQKFNTELNKLTGKDFINAYLQTLEYFKPKQQRTIIEGEIENQNTILDNLTFEELYELKHGRKPD